MNSSRDLIDPSAKIHPSARIHETSRVGGGARIDEEVIVGPHCVVGEGTRLRARVILVEHVTLGEQNDVHPYAVLGGDPQDRSFDESKRGEVVIGDRNIIREHVSINRGNWNGPATRVGSGCYLMAMTHLGHNASIGDQVTMANGAALAGHARVGSGVVMSGYAMVHQFVSVGDGVMFRGGAGVSMHVPPYVVVLGENAIAGLNRVGLKRNPAISPQDRDEVKMVYRALYRDRRGGPILDVIERLSAMPLGPAAAKFVQFCAEALRQQPPRSRGIVGERRTRVVIGPALSEAGMG